MFILKALARHRLEAVCDQSYFGRIREAIGLPVNSPPRAERVGTLVLRRLATPSRVGERRSARIAPRRLGRKRRGDCLLDPLGEQ